MTRSAPSCPLASRSPHPEAVFALGSGGLRLFVQGPRVLDGLQFRVWEYGLKSGAGQWFQLSFRGLP